MYYDGFSDLPDLMLPQYNNRVPTHVYQNYTIRSKQKMIFRNS